MGGVTIAHQHISNETTSEKNFSAGFPESVDSDSDIQAVDEAQLDQLMAATGQWPANLKVEDLTDEVQDLMMRESMNSWLQPWMGENAACLSDFDTQMYAQSIQLGDLFGQDQINFGNDTAFYDELAFAPDDSSLEMSAAASSASSASSPSDISAQISPVVQPAFDIHFDQLSEEIIVQKLEVLEKAEPIAELVEVEEDIEVEDELVKFKNNNSLKRRRGSSSSEGSSDGSSSEEESDSEDETVIPTTVANMNNRRRVSYSSSSDSESDSEPSHVHRSRASSPAANAYVYMHKRQLEETVLDRITNNLNPEKLPGILSILSSEKASNQQDDEVEIDLSCLTREQLVQVLSYVDACILEQNGGPAVNVDLYITNKSAKMAPVSVELEQPKNRRQTKSRNRKPAKPRKTSRAEMTEDIDGDSSDSDSFEYESPVNVVNPSTQGPMSMASLSKANTTQSRPKSTNNRRKPGKAPKNSRRRKGDDDAVVSSSVYVSQDPDSIASSRPKRRAAIHKRRLLEDMLAPSDNEDDEDSEDNVLVVYSDEQMDQSVVDNCTIMHQVNTPAQLISTTTEVVAVASVTEGCEDTDEEIDIMC